MAKNDLTLCEKAVSPPWNGWSNAELSDPNTPKTHWHGADTQQATHNKTVHSAPSVVLGDRRHIPKQLTLLLNEWISEFWGTATFPAQLPAFSFSKLELPSLGEGWP